MKNPTLSRVSHGASRLVLTRHQPDFVHRSTGSAVIKTTSEGAAHALIIIAALSLSACATQPPVVTVERINVPTYVPIAATLTQPVSADLGPNPTWGSAVGALNAGLQTCNGRLDAIKSLKSPDPLPTKGSASPPYKRLQE